MTIEITEKSIALWYVEIPHPPQNLMAHLARGENGAFDLVYRFRYKRDNKAFDSKDDKSWYGGTITNHTEAQALEKMRMLIGILAKKSSGQLYELLRGTGTVEQFMEQLGKMPWAHMRKGDVAGSDVQS